MIKKCLPILLVIALVFSSIALAEEEPQINGYLHSEQGQRILHVWGTYYEMGFAHGYMLGDEIMDEFRGYILELLPPTIWAAGHTVIPWFFGVPDEFHGELEGILDGMRAAGVNTFVTQLGRNLDYKDLLFANAVADLGAMACSTEMAWKDGTIGDPNYSGETIVGRNLDWALAGPDKMLLPRSTIVIVYHPTLPGHKIVASVTFPGFTSCLSCMNEEGVTMVLNIAHNGVGLFNVDFNEGFQHIGITARQALHQDVNHDNVYDINDIIDNVADFPRSGAAVLNLAEPVGDGTGDPAVIMEVDNGGWVLRRPEDEEGFGNYLLAATNDLRKLRSHRKCDRFDLLQERAIASGGRLTMNSLAVNLADVFQNRFLSTTVQTLYFIPHIQMMGVAYSDENKWSTEKNPVFLDWETVTELPEGVSLETDEDLVSEPLDQAQIDEDTETGCGG